MLCYARGTMQRGLSLMGVALLAVASGCMTMPDQATLARQQADMDMLTEEVQRLREQLRRLELEQQNLARELAALEQTARNAGGTNRAQVEELARQIQVLKAAREQDRKWIIEELSRRVAALMASPPSGSAPARTPVRTSEVGYEHVVEAGQTLSEIARAYGVTVDVIMRANNLKSATIRVGQKLFIPKS